MKYLSTLPVIAFVVIVIAAAFTLFPQKSPFTELIPNQKTTPTGSAGTIAPATLSTGVQQLPALSIGTSTFLYIAVVDSCGPYYDGSCVKVRSGPGTGYPEVFQLRTGVVLKVADVVATGTELWYKLDPGSNIRYPERVTRDWYVRSDLVQNFYHTGDELLTETSTTTKKIVVSLGKQMLFAFDGDTVFMQQSVSTGLTDTPTPLGVFEVYRKTPSRYMQGPLPGVSEQYYDLPGVPWDLYFTQDGGAIHGTYWHNHFGQPWSHGCVNLPIDAAKELYEWAPLGTPVLIVS